MTVSDPDILPDEAEGITLVADLDGTLCRTDTLHEALLALISEAPLTLLRLPVWIAEGPAGLKARLADVESRLMSSSQSSMEFESLRSRVMTLESLLHEAAKSRDEAAILRSKVAELDGRLGQAMKAVADSRSKESEKV